ncbi:hypothetical protein ES706_05414 [subsurface metagenome]
MIIYLDTNIILSHFDKTDHFHLQNKNLLDQNDMTYVTGFITIVEFASVLARLLKDNQIQFSNELYKLIHKLPEHDQIKTITETCFGRLNLSILPASGLEKIIINKKEYLVENSFTLAYELGSYLNLRTLDVIQIASAMKVKHFTNFNVDYFLTNDKNILNNAQIIRKNIKIIPISSIELISILKI